MVKLYGFPTSTRTRLVALVCKEKAIPYELIIVDMGKREHKEASFMEKQPFGQVPYIVSSSDDPHAIVTCSQRPPRMTTVSSCMSHARSQDISSRNTRIKALL